MAWILSDQFAINSARSGCINCGNDRPRDLPHGKEPIISCDYELGYEGFAEICGSCVEEAGGMVGMVTGRKYVQATKAKSEAEKELEALKVELAEKSATIRTLTNELNKALTEVPVKA